LQAFYSVRSERLLMEQLDYNLLFRWFVGLGIDDPVWHPTAFTTNRDRLLEGEIAARFLTAVLDHAQIRQLLSREHLLGRWHADRGVGIDEELPPEGGRRAAGWRRNGSRNFHGEQRRNDTHASTTDAEARPFRKRAGKEARLCFMGHLLMENRSGLVVAARLTQATGLAEREAAGMLVEDVAGRHRITVGADRAYDTSDFVAGLRKLGARVTVSVGRIEVTIASACPYRNEFALAHLRLARRTGPALANCRKLLFAQVCGEPFALE
jgi:Transposase domain (DUF772)